MNPLDLVKLTPMMELTTGIPEVTVGLIDGSIAVNNPNLTGLRIYERFLGAQVGRAFSSKRRYRPKGDK